MPEAVRSSLKPALRVAALFLALVHTVAALVLIGALFVYHIDPRWKDLVPFGVAGGFGMALFFWFVYFATLDE
ncbi:MAG TPA: hypothetical protein VM490_09440 [Armatimonadaceae bacterium]|nr:hypothetical protein [Armatimonadaceae bacterium]